MTKEEEKTGNINVYLLINSIACNELTTACRVWYSQVIKSMHTPHLLLVDMSRNKKRDRSVFGLFDFRKMT